MKHVHIISKPWVPYFDTIIWNFLHNVDYLITLPALLTDLSFKIDRDTTFILTNSIAWGIGVERLRTATTYIACVPTTAWLGLWT
jgi:hypothetical protein